MSKGVLHKTAIVLMSVILFASHATAHGNEKHVMGTVTKIDGGTISVQTPSAGEKTVNIGSGTKFMKGQAPATQQDLKVGDRVVIHAKPNGDILEATEVKIGTSTTYDKKAK
jgi:Domain of unknown function (DUF5666)